MQHITRTSAISLLALLMVGCTTPPLNGHLQQAHDQYSALQSKPQAHTLAALETKDAFNALNKADAVSNKDRRDPSIDQLAYLATQKIKLAEQTILGREAEAGLKNIATERTQVQIRCSHPATQIITSLEGEEDRTRSSDYLWRCAVRHWEGAFEIRQSAQIPATGGLPER